MILPYDPTLGHRTGSYAAKEVAYVADAVRLGAALDFPPTRRDCYAAPHPILALAEFVRRRELETE